MTGFTQLPVAERARRWLAVYPAAESGNHGHDATFRAACVCWNDFALDEQATYALLAAEYNPRCKPPWSPAELMHKVQSAAGASHSRPRGHLLDRALEFDQTSSCAPPAAAWPSVNAELQASILADGPGTGELSECSPVSFEVTDGSNAPEILRMLFSDGDRSDPLLCIGKNNSVFATRPLSVWQDSVKLPASSLIVPSPMTARTGKTKAGRESEHTLENTGLRRFLVIEFDQGTSDDHAALLSHLATYAPLALVVHSGGKSLHGWFYCEGQPEESLRRFMRYAVNIGADKATWTRSQFVRLPAGLRENGARQSVLYFNPAAIQRTEENTHEE